MKIGDRVWFLDRDQWHPGTLHECLELQPEGPQSLLVVSDLGVSWMCSPAGVRTEEEHAQMLLAA